MRPKHLTNTLLLMISLFHFSYSQSGNCKVLKPEIATSYSGECKKGLANGNGIAVGADKYEGKLKMDCLREMAPISMPTEMFMWAISKKG